MKRLLGRIFNHENGLSKRTLITIGTVAAVPGFLDSIYYHNIILPNISPSHLHLQPIEVFKRSRAIDRQTLPWNPAGTKYVNQMSLRPAGLDASFEEACASRRRFQYLKFVSEVGLLPIQVHVVRTALSTYPSVQMLLGAVMRQQSLVAVGIVISCILLLESSLRRIVVSDLHHQLSSENLEKSP